MMRGDMQKEREEGKKESKHDPIMFRNVVLTNFAKNLACLGTSRWYLGQPFKKAKVLVSMLTWWCQLPSW
jgi:hypothetical protein